MVICPHGLLGPHPTNSRNRLTSGDTAPGSMEGPGAEGSGRHLARAVAIVSSMTTATSRGLEEQSYGLSSGVFTEES